jgi:hypothetical protein
VPLLDVAQREAGGEDGEEAVALDEQRAAVRERDEPEARKSSVPTASRCSRRR